MSIIRYRIDGEWYSGARSGLGFRDSLETATDVAKELFDGNASLIAVSVVELSEKLIVRHRRYDNAA